MRSTLNDLPEPTRTSVATLLNARLADAIDLGLQAKQAHWNVRGPNFVGLHELFDRVAEQADEYGDLIAERAVALGGVAQGTLRVVGQRSQLADYPLTLAQWPAHVQAVRGALATFGGAVRRAIDETAQLGDAGTADLFTEISRGVDKLLWMVEAHGQDQSQTSGDEP